MQSRTLPQALRDQVWRHPDQEALIFLGHDGTPLPVTYAHLDTDAHAVGRLLLEQGIRPGELVILAFDHGYPLVAAFFGAMVAGAVPAIFPYFTPNSPPKVYRGRVQRLVRQAQARAVVTTSALRAALSTALADVGCPVLAVGEQMAASDSAQTLPIHDAHPEDIAYIQFSSGSTGLPNGVCISHRAALHHIAALSKGFPFGPADVSVGWLPFYHDMGLVTQLLLPLVVGSASVLLPPPTWLRRPDSLFRAIHQYRGTMSWMPNFAFEYCIRHVNLADLADVDLSSWRTLGCGGEPVQLDTMQQFADRFAPFGLHPQALMAGYGMAENTVGVSRSPWMTGIQADCISQTTLRLEKQAQPLMPGSSDALTVVSCGIPFSGTEIAIFDDNDAPLPERHVGEICVRGESLFSGYYRQPEATAQAMRGGWFHTGDLGYLADGQLYVVGRKKDMIITAGENIHPHHIEKAALAAAGSRARRAAAFGYRDERLGTELPVLVVEVRGRMEGSEREQVDARIRQRVQEELNVRLADVRLVRTGWVEVTTSGKIARAATRRKYVDAGWRPASHELLALDLAVEQSLEALEAALTRLVAAVTGKAEVDPHVPLADLGIDSLDMVQLWLLIEKNLGRPAPVEKLAANPTIHHLAILLHNGDLAQPAASSGHPPTDVYPIGPRGVRRPSGVSPRRWRRNRLLERGPLLKGRALPYALGTRLLRAVVGQPRLRQVLYPREVAMLRRCLAAIPVQFDPETVIRQSLMTNSWAAWRATVLSQPDNMARWVTVRNGELLDRLAEQGRGAVLAFPHTQLKKLFRRLPALQGRPLAILGNVGPGTLAASGLPELAEALTRGEALSTTAVRSAQLMNAVKVLRSGGLAYVAADDDNGSGGITAPFHGRLRPFRPGAAELAVQSGAAFVPMFANMSLSGHVTFEFLDPLIAEGATHAQQVDSLLHQYADLLASRYTTDLGAMEWYILRKFLRFPAVDA